MQAQVEVDVLLVRSKEVLLDNGNLFVELLNHESEVVHRHEVGLTPVESHEVLSLELGPDSLLAVEGAGVGGLPQRCKVLVEQLGGLG